MRHYKVIKASTVTTKSFDGKDIRLSLGDIFELPESKQVDQLLRLKVIEVVEAPKPEPEPKKKAEKPSAEEHANKSNS